MQKDTKRPKAVRGAAEKSSDPDFEWNNDRLRFELLSMQARDQAVRDAIMRQSFSGGAADPALITQMEFVDRVHTARLKEIVAEHGWPGHRLVGQEAAASAVLLVLHADNDIAFQKECLPLLIEAIAGGDALARHGAFLTDRIRVNEGRPQWYGTQMKMADGAWVLAEIENGENADEVNRRRASVGLPPLQGAV